MICMVVEASLVPSWCLITHFSF